MFKTISRLRHRHGFGIHSPFAYRFVTEVLCQELPYYGYEEIGRDRRLRLLLRLAAYLAPERVAIFADDDSMLRRAASRGYSKIEYTTDSPDMIVADDLDAGPETYLPLLIEGGTHALIVNASPALRQNLSSALTCGMIFDNGQGSIVVAGFRHLPRQDFDVKF